MTRFHHPFLLVVVVLLAPVCEAQQFYRLTDLGDFPGNLGTRASAINESGQIVGESFASPVNRSFIWDEVNGLQDLGVLPGANGTHAQDINDAGVVTGFTSSALSRAFLWSGGPLVDLGEAPGGFSSRGLAINNNGVVVGNGSNAIIWDSVNGLRLLLDPAGVLALNVARDINDAGTVVGLTNNEEAFVMRAGQAAVELGKLSPAHIQSDAFGVNDLDQVVGYSRPTAQTARGWYREPGSSIQDIGALDPAHDLIQPRAINNAGQVVGVSTDSFSGGAFIWTQAEGMRNLNAMIDPLDPLINAVTLNIAHDINESGQIAADGFIGGFLHAFLLTPVTIGDPPEAVVFDFAGPTILVEPFGGTGTFANVMLGDSMAGRFIVIASEDVDSNGTGIYEFPSNNFFAEISDGTTQISTEDSVRNMEVSFENNVMLDADGVALVNDILNMNLPVDTEFDIIHLETDVFEGTRRLEVGVSFISLDTSFIAGDGAYRPLPGPNDVDLAVYFIFEEDDSGDLYSAIGRITGQSVISGNLDTDMDGVPDFEDNCILVSNGPLTMNIGDNEQRDTNEDGFGNICDPDLNNDGIVNALDLGLFKLVFFTADEDADFDGSGSVNAVDLGILRSFFFLPPGPSGVVL